MAQMDGMIWGGKWNHVRQLGSGGEGDTYVVVSQTEPPREGVLKQGKRPSSKARSRMLNEVGHLNLLHEAGVKVPAVLDSGNTAVLGMDEPPWFVMDFIPGKTLDAELQVRGRLNLDQAVAVTFDLAGTIAMVHRAGVLHRDLKPSNLMVRGLDAKADIVLLDCGLSFHEDAATEDLTGDEPIRNRFLSLSEGNTPGGNRRDPRSDLTAVAGILFYCLARQNIGHLFDQRGLPPHHRDGCLMQDVLAGDPRLRQVDLFFDRAFAADISSRFQSPDELVLRLATLADQPAGTFRNPLEVANTRAARLRQQHRKTQLAEYGQLIQETLRPRINEWLSQTALNLTKPYVFSSITLADDFTKSLPAGMESMIFEGNTQSVLLAATMQYQVHANSWLIVVRTAVRGSEGVLLAAITRFERRIEFLSPWEELMQFNPTNLPPVADFIRQLDECLCRAIDKLSDDVERT